MSWRTVIIGSRAKLDFKMNYMIVRKDQEISKIYLSEIYLLIIESTAVSLTAVLINELMKAKVKIIFCDEKRNPASEINALYGSHNTSKRCREQIGWSEEIKSLIWTELIRRKIKNQATLLKNQNKEECKLLYSYLEELVINDETQREGHAAKVYFNALFGKSFSREQENTINASLNYGYAILLSAINREIVGQGYLTQIGLCHKNQFNPFNLGSDLIEPLRGVVDYLIVTQNYQNFDRDTKYDLVSLLSKDVIIDSSHQVLSAAIRIYCKSVFTALTENNSSLIRFVDYEL